MTKCNDEAISFPRSIGRSVEGAFNGGEITSDAGVLLLRQEDRRLGLLERVSEALPDPRASSKVVHDALSLLRQRVYALALGYEDLIDHQHLRRDLALQTAVERHRRLSSVSTLHRFEQWCNRETAWTIHEVLVDQFIASHNRPPRRIILDFDATDIPVHGEQEMRFFHGYYDHYCFLPLYVFCGDHLLCAYLRPSRIDGAKHAWAILSLLVQRIRRSWPHVRIIFRGDSGFCRHQMLDWCERDNVKYIVGIARNARLKAQNASLMQQAEDAWEASGRKQRLFGEFAYAAGTWKKERRIIAKAEHTAQGANPRYVVTNIEGDPQQLYDRLYCARGEMENRIKEQQLDLFADRTSAHAWMANQFRLLLAALAYTLIEAIRRLALSGTRMGRALCSTIRLRLLKIGAVILKNTRRIRLLMPSAYPWQHLFRIACRRLA